MWLGIDVFNADETHPEHHQAGAEQGCFQFLALAPVALPGEQRSADRPRLRQTTRRIHQRTGDDLLGDTPQRLALAGGNARHALNDYVVAGTVSVRAVVPKRRTFTIDDFRIDGGKRS